MTSQAIIDDPAQLQSACVDQGKDFDQVRPHSIRVMARANRFRHWPHSVIARLLLPLAEIIESDSREGLHWHDLLCNQNTVANSLRRNGPKTFLDSAQDRHTIVVRRNLQHQRIETGQPANQTLRCLGQFVRAVATMAFHRQSDLASGCATAQCGDNSGEHKLNRLRLQPPCRGNEQGCRGLAIEDVLHCDRRTEKPTPLGRNADQRIGMRCQAGLCLPILTGCRTDAIDCPLAGKPVCQRRRRGKVTLRQLRLQRIEKKTPRDAIDDQMMDDPEGAARLMETMIELDEGRDRPFFQIQGTLGLFDRRSDDCSARIRGKGIDRHETVPLPHIIAKALDPAAGCFVPAQPKRIMRRNTVGCGLLQAMDGQIGGDVEHHSVIPMRWIGQTQRKKPLLDWCQRQWSRRRSRRLAFTQRCGRLRRTGQGADRWLGEDIPRAQHPAMLAHLRDQLHGKNRIAP